MPKLIVDKSLYEPVTIEAGGKVYETIPLSPWLIRAIEVLQKKHAESKDSLSYVVEMAALIFGISAEEVDRVDIRVLQPAIEFVVSEMNMSRKSGAPSADEAKIADAIADAGGPKNEPTPEAAPSL